MLNLSSKADQTELKQETGKQTDNTRQRHADHRQTSRNCHSGRRRDIVLEFADLRRFKTNSDRDAVTPLCKCVIRFQIRQTDCDAARCSSNRKSFVSAGAAVAQSATATPKPRYILI